jgi:hypothetical protein
LQNFKQLKSRGPLLDSKRYKKSPTTTGGRPIKVFNRLIIKPLPGNFLKPTIEPTGRPKAVAIIRAIPET